MSERVIDLDEQRRERPSEQVVVIGGERFRARGSVRPEVLIPWDDFYLGEDTSSGRAVAIADETVLAFLLPDEHDRYRALRAREDDPLTIGDLNLLITGLIEAAVARPTEAPSGSSAGTENGAPPSTAASSSPEATQTG